MRWDKNDITCVPSLQHIHATAVPPYVEAPSSAIILSLLFDALFIFCNLTLNLKIIRRNF